MSDNMATRLRKQIGGRNLMAKIIGFGLLGAIGIVFVFSTDIAGRMGMGIASVARVNDTLISAADMQQEENRLQEYYNKIFNGGLNLSGQQRNMLRQQAVQTLISQELTAQGARHEGIRASDAEVRSVILEEPSFNENGQFIRERYLSYLQYMRLSPGDFEGRIRKSIESIRVRQLLETVSRPLPLELEKMKELQSHQMNISFARLEAEALTKSGVKVDNAQIQAKLQDVDFLKKAEEYFQAYKADWSSPETVTAQHLLITFKPGDAQSEKEALAKIQDLKKRAEKEDFGKLAAQFSEDPGSKAQNGRLEPFSRGRMVKEFEDAAFTQEIGKVGSPVKSPFGYHLIKVNQRTLPKEANFEEAKTEVARRLLAREMVDEQLKSLDEAVSAGDSQKVDQILKAVGAKWEETGLFDLSNPVPRLPAGPVAEAAFEVTSSKPLLNRVVRDGGARYVLRLKETKTVPAPSMADAEELIQKRRADSVFMGWLENFRKNSRVDVNPQVFRQ